MPVKGLCGSAKVRFEAVTTVDYLAGNGAPLYRWRAIGTCGGFDAGLFFGFEDLDLGRA